MRDCLIGGYRNDKEVIFLECFIEVREDKKVVPNSQIFKSSIDDMVVGSEPDDAICLADILSIHPNATQIIVDYKHDGEIYRLIDNPLTNEKEWAKVGTTIGYEVI